uniref:hypothetical protein n=1 Tax=Candidatus Fimivicinus sp. TaxID=3056640 RepID=UPI003FF0B573
MLHHKNFKFLEHGPSVRVVSQKSGRRSLFGRMRDALAESAPALTMEEIKKDVAPEQEFSAALACLIFRILRDRRGR